MTRPATPLPRGDGDSPGRRVDAAQALAPGRWDATAVLLLRCLRTASIVVVVAGVAVAVATHSEDQMAEATSPDTVLQALVTPLAVLAVGVVLRVLVAPTAYALALVLVVRDQRHVVRPGDTRSTWSHVADRARLAGAYRALRWTTALRDESVGRLGRRGRVLDRVATALRVLLVVACAGVVAAVALR